MKPIIVRRTAGIGDSLSATVVADLLHEQGHEVVWQTHPEIIPIIKRHPTIMRVEPPKGSCDVDLDGSYEKCATAHCAHFHDIFITVAAQQLERMGVTISLNRPPKPPQLKRNVNAEQAMMMRLRGCERPWVMIVPRSFYQTRCVPDAVWSEVLDLIRKNDFCSLFWLGEHPSPTSRSHYRPRSLSEISDLISVADLVVTVDTGPMHIASAYGVPMVVISQSHDVHLRLSPLSDFEIVKRRDLDCLNCQRHRCPIDPYNPPCGQIDPKELAEVVNRKLAQLEPSNPIAA